MQLTDIGLRYQRGGPWVLDQVTATIDPGDTIVLDGRNGVGKSTLLQVIVGVLRPTRGRVTGRPQVVAWVPERFPAGQPFTVAQYLRFVAGMRGLAETAARDAAEAWMDRLGLGGFSGSRLPDLSKGTAQKVGLAQALLVPPQLLVLDEPWEGLDKVSRELVPTLLAEVCAAGGATVVSDHRGEAGRLPGAITWRLDETGFHHEPAPTGETCLVEVEVSAATAPAVAALLRTAGHDQVRIRPAARTR
ncbi:MAG TPA: ATP-binding cassette domain-containing protein [Micromonosporaceae bacterium]